MAGAQNDSVLQDVDDSIRSFLRTRARITNDIEIVFEAPTRDWAARRNTPTIDVFLYDIRENLDRRQAMFEDSRNADLMVTGRPQATRWYNCSYLITAWTQRPEDEHRLLGSVLLGFLEVHALPTDVLSGRLSEMEREVFVTIGRPLAQERSISDIWSALGGELKPSLDLVLVVPFEPAGDRVIGPPVLEAPSLRVGDPSTGAKGSGSADPEEREGGHRRAKGGPVGFKSTQQSGAPKSLLERRADRLAQEESIGGSPAVPGRRFRFSVHEPKVAEKKDEEPKKPAPPVGASGLKLKPEEVSPKGASSKDPSAGEPEDPKSSDKKPGKGPK